MNISKQKEDAPLKSENQVSLEISAVLRQITASISFLPVLEEPCTFNILAYTDKDAMVPGAWVDSDPKLIEKDAEQVRLKSFSTGVHDVDSLVAYKVVE